jgi:hypothetical protein
VVVLLHGGTLYHGQWERGERHAAAVVDWQGLSHPESAASTCPEAPKSAAAAAGYRCCRLLLLLLLLLVLGSHG